METIYLKKKKSTCYLCTEKHRDIGRDHREFNLNPNVATLLLHLGIPITGEELFEVCLSKMNTFDFWPL